MADNYTSETNKIRLLTVALLLSIVIVFIGVSITTADTSPVQTVRSGSGLTAPGITPVLPDYGLLPAIRVQPQGMSLVYGIPKNFGNSEDIIISSGEGTGTSSDSIVEATRSAPIIANHTIARLPLLKRIPRQYFNAAKSSLRIFYAHTSHGSQITTGMTGLTTFAGAPQPASQFRWNEGGVGGALNIAEISADLGENGDLTWAQTTREYLAAHPNVNVVMWSWCGQVSWNTAAGITAYLNEMSRLEKQFPRITFIYMTGHLDGTGTAGNLNVRNNQIRAYCIKNNKVLFDFADIESYNPDNVYFLNRGADDGCNYNSGNWAVQWQNSHKKGVYWYECEAAHTEPLNANMKAYAAWWMWARLGGWNGKFNPIPVITSITPTSGYNNRTVSVIINGTNFRTGATISLVKGGIIKKGSVMSVIGTRIKGFLPLSRLTPGYWNLTVTNTDGTAAKKVNAFRVLSTRS